MGPLYSESGIGEELLPEDLFKMFLAQGKKAVGMIRVKACVGTYLLLSPTPQKQNGIK
jgi:hypothetical protein